MPHKTRVIPFTKPAQNKPTAVQLTKPKLPSDTQVSPRTSPQVSPRGSPRYKAPSLVPYHPRVEMPTSPAPLSSRRVLAAPNWEVDISIDVIPQKRQVDETVQIVMDASVYWNIEQRFNLKENADRADQIAQIAREARILEPTPLLQLPSFNTVSLNIVQFSQALEIYENNQTHYAEQLTSANQVESDRLIGALSEMEWWFIQFIEPYTDDLENWIKREGQKLSGHSAYCDPTLCQHLNSPPLPVMNLVRGNYQYLAKQHSNLLPEKK
jgi:hypothetical protein